MNEGDTLQEHVQSLRDYLEKMSTTDTWGWDDAAEDLDAIEAALAKLRGYARAVELKWWNEVDRRANGHPDMANLIEDFRAEKEVADLMEGEA